MNKSKFVVATAALGSCTFLSLLGFSRNTSEALGVSPMANFSIDYTSENQFSRFIVQQSSIK